MPRRFKFAVIFPVLNVGLAWVVFSLPVRYAELGPTSDFAIVGFANSICFGVNAPALALWNASSRLFRNGGTGVSIQSSLFYIGFWWFLVGIALNLRNVKPGGLLNGLQAAACSTLGAWVLFLAIGAAPTLLFTLTVLHQTGRDLQMIGTLIEVSLSIAWGGFLLWVAFKHLRGSSVRRVTAA